MYTAHQVQAKIKPECYDTVFCLLNVWHEIISCEDAIAKHPILEEFLRSFRAESFTHWFADYMEWEKGEYPLSFENGVLTLEGCVKACPDRNRSFGELLDLISEEIIFYRTWYEEDETFRFWENGGFKWNPEKENLDFK